MVRIHPTVSFASSKIGGRAATSNFSKTGAGAAAAFTQPKYDTQQFATPTSSSFVSASSHYQMPSSSSSSSSSQVAPSYYNQQQQPQQQQQQQQQQQAPVQSVAPRWWFYHGPAAGWQPQPAPLTTPSSAAPTSSSYASPSYATQPRFKPAAHYQQQQRSDYAGGATATNTVRNKKSFMFRFVLPYLIFMMIMGEVADYFLTELSSGSSVETAHKKESK